MQDKFFPLIADIDIGDGMNSFLSTLDHLQVLNYLTRYSIYTKYAQTCVVLYFVMVIASHLSGFMWSIYFFGSASLKQVYSDIFIERLSMKKMGKCMRCNAGINELHIKSNKIVICNRYSSRMCFETMSSFSHCIVFSWVCTMPSLCMQRVSPSFCQLAFQESNLITKFIEKRQIRLVDGVGWTVCSQEAKLPIVEFRSHTIY